MNYKKILPVLPFIVVFFVLSIFVEMNVSSESSPLIALNRALIPAVGILCVLITKSNISLRFIINLSAWALVVEILLFRDTTIGRSFYKGIGPYHGTYYTGIFYLLLTLFMFWGFDVISRLLNRNGRKVSHI